MQVRGVGARTMHPSRNCAWIHLNAHDGVRSASLRFITGVEHEATSVSTYVRLSCERVSW